MDKEILEGFKEESNQILIELNAVVEKLEEARPETYQQELSEFAQKIDRIMGSAKTLELMEPGNLGLERIGKLAALCKALGYKAAEVKAVRLLPFFAAFWADTLEVISELISVVEDAGKSKKVASAFSAVVQKRLEWLSLKLQAPTESGKEAPKDILIDLLKDLNLD